MAAKYKSKNKQNISKDSNKRKANTPHITNGKVKTVKVKSTNIKTADLPVTVEQLYNEYLSNTKGEIRQSTLRCYSVNFTHHILPDIGQISLDRLTIRRLVLWKAYINEKNLSLVTKKNIYASLRLVLNYAVKMEYIQTNPLLKVGNFKDSLYQESDIQFYTPEEFKLYITKAYEFRQQNGIYDYYIFFMLRYYTGRRKGEIHALRWNCINGNKLHIKRSINQKLKGDDVETPPKNKSSIRVVQLPLPLLEALEKHKKHQQACVNNWNDAGFICGYYRPLRDTAIDNENRKYSLSAGLKRIRVHDFRHSHASLLINCGINALEVAHRLGHSSVDQTLKTYSHLFPTESEKALDILNNIQI